MHLQMRYQKSSLKLILYFNICHIQKLGLNMLAVSIPIQKEN